MFFQKKEKKETFEKGGGVGTELMDHPEKAGLVLGN